MLNLFRRLISQYRVGSDPGLPPSLVAGVRDEQSAAAAIEEFRKTEVHEERNLTAAEKWLDISVQGFSEQQQGRQLAHLIKELLQNALDSIVQQGTISLWITSSRPGEVSVLCSDDGAGADLRTVNVMFHTNKKDSALKRGRMGRGFKEILSVSSFAMAESQGCIRIFTRDEKGSVVAKRSPTHPRHGFHVLFDIKHEGSVDEAISYLRTIMPAPGILLQINGRIASPRNPTHVVHGELETEVFLAGYWQRREEHCRVNLVQIEADEVPLIYEMGIPICPVDWPEPYHCDVLQRVPMNPNRDAVVSGYARSLRAMCFPTLVHELSQLRAQAPWTAEAVMHFSRHTRKDRLQLMQALIKRAYIQKVARSSPPLGRYDFDASAAEEGYLIVNTETVPYDLSSILREVALTSEEIVKQKRQRLTLTARRSSLSTEQVGIQIVKEKYAARAGGIRQAISAYGKEQVMDRMAFALWLSQSILAEMGLASDAVTVRCAWMPQGVLASWSESSILFLSLAHDAIWSEPIGRDLIALVIHEAAHDQAFHHGAAFTHKVEEFAGACAVVCLDVDREVLSKRFATFAKGTARNPRATS